MDPSSVFSGKTEGESKSIEEESNFKKLHILTHTIDKD